MSETYDLGGAVTAEPPEEGSPPSPAEPAAEPAADAALVPLGVVVAPTGNTEVDTAVERLADADGLPTAEHVEVYEDVHRELRDALTALDENRS